MMSFKTTFFSSHVFSLQPLCWLIIKKTQQIITLEHWAITFTSEDVRVDGKKPSYKIKDNIYFGTNIN